MFTTPIIAPVSADLIRQELTPDKLLRATNKGGNEIYVFHASTAPETMREIGRLREEAFRFYGGGTGKDCDIDEFDTDLRAYQKVAQDLVGTDVGTPVIRVNGMALFGPVISPAPKGEAAGELFDGFVKVTAYPGFFELKRSRDVGPIFD